LYKFIIALGLIFFILRADAQYTLPVHPPVTDSLKRKPAVLKLSPDIYVKSLGIMCRQEWKVEKYLHVPLRVRMGSLEHCNYLEGKK
jgi:hypothetical protein